MNIRKHSVPTEADTINTLRYGKVAFWFDVAFAGEYLEEVEDRLNAFSEEHWGWKLYPTEKQPVFMSIGRDFCHALIMAGIELQSQRTDYNTLLPFLINYEFE